jgi:hypothetical protein
MDIGDNGDGARPLDPGQGMGSIGIGHRTTDYFAADVCKPFDLGSRGRHIAGIGAAHRLHGTGCISSDRDGADMYLSADFFHGAA